MIYSGIKNILKKFRDLLLDDVYYLGSLYCTFNSSDNPNGRLPGTWARLPDGVFIRNAGGNAGTVGNIQAEGIPDIKGRDAISWYGVHTGAINNGNLRDGCFDDDDKFFVDRWGNDYGGASETVPVGVSFKASKGEVHGDGFSNLVYGKSDHVTPVNVALYMWKRTA